MVDKGLPNSTAVELGLRPESFVLSSKRDDKADIVGKIYVTEPLGEDMIIDIAIGKEQVKAKTVIGYEWKIDEPVYLRIKYDRVHLFAGDTGVSLLE